MRCAFAVILDMDNIVLVSSGYCMSWTYAMNISLHIEFLIYFDKVRAGAHMISKVTTEVESDEKSSSVKDLFVFDNNYFCEQFAFS